MMRQTINSLQTDHLKALCRQAGEAVMAVYDSADFQTQAKSDNSPVTQADLQAHHILAAGLGQILPVPVVSEEDSESLVHRTATGSYWLIDPLDGTKEFLSRSHEFTVNVALIEDGRAVWGMVYAPALDELFWGAPGTGAWLEANGVVTELALSSTGCASVLRVVASKSHMNAQTTQFIERLGATELVQAGSSLKFCRVAQGMAEIYPRLGPTCEWDTAAAQAVLEGAGGVVVDEQGEPLKYGKSEVLNPNFIAASRPALARAMPRP